MIKNVEKLQLILDMFMATGGTSSLNCDHYIISQRPPNTLHNHSFQLLLILTELELVT